VRLPIDTTVQELGEMFGPGSYRVEACDEVGEPIDYVATVSVGEGAESADGGASAVMRNGISGGGVELRAALDVIDQLAKTNGEALRAVADAQAEYVKSLAAAKLIPRNVAMPPVAPPTARNDGDDNYDDEDDESDDEDADEYEDDDEAQVAPPPPSPMKQLETMLAPALLALAPKLIELVQGLMADPSRLRDLFDWRRAASKTVDAPAAAEPSLHLVRIRNALTPPERGFLDELLAEEEVAALVLKELTALSVEQAVARLRAQMRPPARPEPPPRNLMSQVMAVRGLLDPREQLAAMQLLPRLSPVDRKELEAKLLAMTPEEAAAWIRVHLPELSKAVAS
jgi:hypothetical protein